MWMSRDLVCVRPDSSVDEAIKLMSTMKIRRLLVTDDDNRLLGLLSKQDALQAPSKSYDQGNDSIVDSRACGKVKNRMAQKPLTIDSHESIATAARVMRNRKFGALPVINKARLVGIITDSDILDAFVSMMDCSSPSILFTLLIDECESDWLESLVNLAKTDDCNLLSVTRLEHKSRQIAVVRVSGDSSNRFVESLWKTGMSVLSVQAEG